jgi:hypothetical protein
VKQPVEFDGSVLAMIPVTENEVGAEGAGGVPTGGIGFGAVIQPGMRISSSSSDKERKANLLNVVTSKNILPSTSTRPYS